MTKTNIIRSTRSSREPELVITNKDNSVQYVNISNIYRYFNAGYGREEKLKSATDILKSAWDIDEKKLILKCKKYNNTRKFKNYSRKSISKY